jgi:hypothetical protein
MNNAVLHLLGARARIKIAWCDVSHVEPTMSGEMLGAVLGATGLPVEMPEQIQESQGALRQETGKNSLRPGTADLQKPILLLGTPRRFRIILESGQTTEGVPIQNGADVLLPAIDEPAYHQLEFNNSSTIVAVAPPRAYMLDAARKV